MRRVTGRTAERGGFTLIELLVVIAIIGVLAALVASAVVKVVGASADVQASNEIRQLNVSLETFKAKFGSYPPSQIYLANDLKTYLTGGPPGVSKQLMQDSLNFIQHVWPHIDLTSGVNWGLASGLLTGDQCLTFFLGGMCDPTDPAGPVLLGFSTNPKNPTLMPASPQEQRIGPFFDFDRTRVAYPGNLPPFPQPNSPIQPPNLWQPLPAPPRQNPHNKTFPVYVDVYGAQPYAYFNSGKRPNGYNTTSDCPYLVSYPTSIPPKPYDAFAIPTPPYKPVSILPYVYPSSNLLTTPNRFYNPNTFQIISAGKDKIWGWPLVTNKGIAPPAPQLLGDFDDMSNFTSSRIGVGAGT